MLEIQLIIIYLYLLCMGLNFLFLQENNFSVILSRMLHTVMKQLMLHNFRPCMQTVKMYSKKLVCHFQGNEKYRMHVVSKITQFTDEDALNIKLFLCFFKLYIFYNKCGFFSMLIWALNSHILEHFILISHKHIYQISSDFE